MPHNGQIATLTWITPVVPYDQSQSKSKVVTCCITNFPNGPASQLLTDTFKGISKATGDKFGVFGTVESSFAGRVNRHFEWLDEPDDQGKIFISGHCEAEKSEFPHSVSESALLIFLDLTTLSLFFTAGERTYRALFTSSAHLKKSLGPSRLKMADGKILLRIGKTRESGEGQGSGAARDQTALLVGEP